MIGLRSNSKSHSDGRKPASGPVKLYRRAFWRRPIFATLLFLLVLFSIGGFVAFHYATAEFRERADSFDMEKIGDVEKTSLIYDRHGEEIGQIHVEDRRPVDIEDIPWEFVQALVATEDSRFFQHEGFDAMGFCRAMLRNVRSKLMGRQRRQGASTITQQLARNAYDLTREKKVSRKITEIYLARRIEERYTKPEILQFYLNRIYFGGGFHGANTAALGYFGKPISDLTLDESAILVGIIKLPHGLAPTRNPEGALRARDYVLGRMRSEGMIEQSEYDELTALPLALSTTERETSYAKEAVRLQVLDVLAGQKGVAQGGLRIETTLDAVLQETAEASLRRRLSETETTQGYPHPTYDEHQALVSAHRAGIADGSIAPDTKPPVPAYLQGSLLAIDNRSGEVLAMVGGRDFGDTEYNRTTALRPLGTAFTPFVYGAAFEKRLAYPGSLLDDAPIDNRRVMVGGFTGILGEWGLEAAAKPYLRKIPARISLALGKNAATVRLGEKLGLDSLREFSARAGIKAEMKYPSSYLGSHRASLSDMTRAYAAFPSGGQSPKRLHFIRRIEDSEGNVIYRSKPESIVVTDPVTAYQVHSCLEDVLTRGTGSRASEFGYDGFPAGAKTGTHYGFTDLWFLGYNSNVTCGVWVGFDFPQTIYEGAFSNRIALPVWVDVMKRANQLDPGAAIAAPAEGSRFLEVCSRSGLLATDACYDEINGRFVSTARPELIHADFQFDQFCDVHGGSEAPSKALTQLLKPAVESVEETGAPLVPGAIVGVEPVRIRASTLVGTDPYSSLRPLLRAQIVQDEDEGYLPPNIPKARPLEVGYGRKETRVKVAPPKPLEID